MVVHRLDLFYFLYTLNQAALGKAVFPVGHLDKTAVRQIARDAGLSVHEVSSTKDVLELLHLGNGRRTTESTRSNDASSRSHAILQCYIPVVLADGRTKITKLSLIDLAGSERAIATEGRSARSVEGANINKSLLALSSCIHALCEGRKHIPYRNSKLTQLLRDSLGGAAKTVMIANVSPCSTQIGETSNTLHWANRAKEIRAVEVMHDDVSAGPSDGSALFGATACYAADNADLVSVLQARVAALEEENVQLVRERDAALLATTNQPTNKHKPRRQGRNKP